MGWNNQAITLIIIEEEITGFSGLFGYSPKLGHGNLIFSVAAASGTDPYGNNYDQGITVYTRNGGLLANLLAGILTFGDTLSADPLTYGGLLRLIHMAAHGDSPIVALDSPAADVNESHTSLWLLGAPDGYTSGPLQAGAFAFQGAATELPLEWVFALGPGGRLSFGQILPSGVTPTSMMWLAPSGDATGATDAGALDQAFNVSGYDYVFLLPGTYYVDSTVSMGIGQRLIGAGINATIVNWTGTGDCFSQTYSGPYSGLTTVGGGITDLTIDGTSSTAPSAGIHAGDIESLCYDRTFIRNFAGVGDIGFHFDNRYTQTERLSGELHTANCASGYVFDVNGGTGSFARPNLVLECNTASGSQNGVVVQAGANIYDPVRFAICGNFSGTGGTGGAVLTVTGGAVGSRIQAGRLSIGVETNSAGIVQTIKFGSSVNVIVDTEGVLDFSLGGGTFAASNVGTAGAFRHDGPIRGDSSLVRSQYFGTRAQGAIGTGGTIFTSIGDNISVNPAAAITGIILAPGARDGDRLTIENLSAFTVTFATAGTSNVAAGAGATVPALGSRLFIWNAAQALWYGGV